MEENLHIRFSESTPNVVGSGPDWLFDIDALTRTMNYEPIVVGTQSNGFADPEKENECNNKEKEDNVNNTNNVNTFSLTVNVTCTNEDNELLFDPNMPALEDVSTFNFLSDNEDDGAMADMNNLDTTIQVSHIPNTRIRKDHPLDQVIGDLQTSIQTRKMSKNLEEHRTESDGGPRCQETMRDTTAQTRFESVSKNFNDSLLARGNTLRSDEDIMKLNELMALCTTLQNRVLELEEIKTSQHNEIASLKRRVEKLEKRNRSRTHKLKRLYKLGLTARVESSDDEESLEKAKLKQLMETIPNEEKVAIGAIPLAVKSPRIVNWKIHKEGKKSLGSKEVFGSIILVLIELLMKKLDDFEEEYQV
nr:hypothetical protein [Tanacetum cinerariifolium]